MHLVGHDFVEDSGLRSEDTCKKLFEFLKMYASLGRASTLPLMAVMTKDA